jgi:DNA N-6-adenine-methyltransferase (Dam)
MTLGSHQKKVGDSQTWITPRWILDAIGRFDLDPAGADPRPWDCATTTYTKDGLSLPWYGRVFLNPPFNRYVVSEWICRLAAHGRGTALLHARVETEWFEPCWEHAAAVLFLRDRSLLSLPGRPPRGSEFRGAGMLDRVRGLRR